MFEPRIALDNVLTMVVVIVGAAVVWGSTRERLDRHDRDIERHQQIIEKLIEMEAETSATSKTLMEMVKDRRNQ